MNDVLSEWDTEALISEDKKERNVKPIDTTVTSSCLDFKNPADLLSKLTADQTPQFLEEACPTLLALSERDLDKSYRRRLEDAVLSLVSFKDSRLVRKTCIHVLHNWYSDPSDELFFLLFNTFEESQYHVIEPVLPKFDAFVHRIVNGNTSFDWRGLRILLVQLIHHPNGWVRAFGLQKVVTLDASLLEQDLEFLSGVYYPALNAYDPFWRIDESMGLTKFIQKLKVLHEKMLSYDFVRCFLTTFSKRFSPVPLFFISLSLPEVSKPLLSEQDVPLCKQVLTEVQNLQYTNLKHDAVTNFANFVLSVVECESEQYRSGLLNILPFHVRKTVKPNQRTEPENSAQTEISTSNAVNRLRLIISSGNTAQIDETIQFLMYIFHTENLEAVELMCVCCTVLSSVSLKTRKLLLEDAKMLARENQKSCQYVRVCRCWVQIAVSLLDMDMELGRLSLEGILQLTKRNNQVALIMATELSTRALTPDLSNLMLSLAIYGDVLKKDDMVLHLAHQMASKSGSELDELDKLISRTRETSILAICRPQNDPEFLNAIIKDVLEKCTEVDKIKSRTFGLSLGHRLKTRLLCLLLVLVRIRPENKYREQVIEMCMTTVVDGSQQYSIRLPAEWILTYLCGQSDQFFQKFLLQDTQICSRRIGAVVAWLLVVTRSLRLISTEEYVTEALLRFLPWTTVQNFGVRCAALACVDLLSQWFPDHIKRDPQLAFVKHITAFKPDLQGNSKTVVENLLSEPYLVHLHPSQLDLRTVFSDLPRLCGMPDDELIFCAPIPPSLTECLPSFLTSYSNQDVGTSEIFSALVKNQITAPEALSLGTCVLEEVDGGVQRKFDTAHRKKRKEGVELWVVASLINKTTNLGGLCRTCEVLGASGLIVSTLNVLNDQNFKALSMSAEKWLNMYEVKTADLPKFLETAKLLGFAVVAAEQTSNSVSLHEFQFPDKTVLLLGEEKKGIPPNLIRAVDHAVEIEQYGQTRSLNVHVSASLFVSQFATQKLID